MGSQYKSVLRNLIRYCGIAFGTGYALLFIGLIAILGEAVIRTMPYSGSYGPSLNLPISIVLAAVLLFIAVLCGIGFGVSIARNSSWRKEEKTANRISQPIFLFSIMILLLGVGVLVAISSLHSSLSTYFSYSSLPSFGLTTPISLVAGAVILLIGYQVFAKEMVESKLIGGILMIVSVVLIYIVALSPIRNLGNLVRSIPGVSGIGLPPLPGFLAGEINIEVVSLLIVAVCAVLCAFPNLRSGKGSNMLKVILSIAAIVFGAGLLYFNFSMVSTMSNFISLAGQYLISIWLVFVGFLVLGISGILIITSASVSIGLSIKEIQTALQTPPPPPPPP